MAKIKEPLETAHMSKAALVCRSQGHALEGLDTALPSTLKGAGAEVELWCKRFNPGNPSQPIMCGYFVKIEVSLRNGQLVSRVPKYDDPTYLKAKEDAGTGRLARDDVRGALLSRLVG